MTEARRCRRKADVRTALVNKLPRYDVCLGRTGATQLDDRKWWSVRRRCLDAPPGMAGVRKPSPSVTSDRIRFSASGR
jgi:hypothetical protein